MRRPPGSLTVAPCPVGTRYPTDIPAPRHPLPYTLPPPCPSQTPPRPKRDRRDRQRPDPDRAVPGRGQPHGPSLPWPPIPAVGSAQCVTRTAGDAGTRRQPRPYAIAAVYRPPRCTQRAKSPGGAKREQRARSPPTREEHSAPPARTCGTRPVAPRPPRGCPPETWHARVGGATPRGQPTAPCPQPRRARCPDSPGAAGAPPGGPPRPPSSCATKRRCRFKSGGWRPL